MDDVACSCDELFMLLESVRDGIIRVCPSESLESRNDLLGMVCAWDAFVECNVKPNTVWSLSLSTAMQPCGRACCGVH